MENLQLKDMELEQLMKVINENSVTTTKTGESYVSEKDFRTGNDIGKYDESIYFEALNAGMPTEKIGSPIFFIPANEGRNGLANIVEPFKKVGIPTVREMYTIIQNDTAAYNFCHVLADQAIGTLLSNIDIIFQDGFFKVMRTFSRDPYTLVNLYNDAKSSIGVESFMYKKLDNLFHSLVKANMTKDDSLIRESMMVNLADFKGYMADTCCSVVYYIVNQIMNDVYTDIDGLAGYFEAEGVTMVHDLGDQSKHSMCTQCSVMLSNRDIARIVEISELIFVGFFYNVNDIVHQAYIDGVFNNYIEQN